jgi:hypothetical protein
MKGSGWPGRCAARVFFERHISPRRNQMPLLPLWTVRDERQAASAALVGVWLDDALSRLTFPCQLMTDGP